MKREYTLEETRAMIIADSRKWTIKRSQKLNELYAKNPVCIYCGILTKNDYEIRFKKAKKKELYPKDMATIEHIYDRFDIRRYDPEIPQERKLAIACYECNNKRARTQTEKLNKIMMKKLKKFERDKTQPRALMYIEFIK